MGSLSLSPGDLPNPGSEPRYPKLQADSLPAESFEDFPGGLDSKVSAYNVGDPSSIPGSGRGRVRSPGEGNGNPLQYSCLENPMDRGAW